MTNATRDQSDLRLDGKVALVTGAGRGLGAAFAVQLAQAGADVVVNYANSSQNANAVVKEIESIGRKAVAIKADISDVSQITVLFEEVIKHFSRIDIVVSNAGMELFSPEEEVTVEMYDRVFNLNTRAQFFIGANALKYCQENGRIIFMSSISAQARGTKNHAVYAGSKAAIEGFVRAFSSDAGPKKITVNGIAPGGVVTDMFYENAWRYTPGATKDTPVEDIMAKAKNLSPLGRCAVPEDIARVVAMLVSPDARWINGQVITISGGAAH